MNVQVTHAEALLARPWPSCSRARVRHARGNSTWVDGGLRLSFKGDIRIDIDVDMDIDSDMAVSIN